MIGFELLAAQPELRPARFALRVLPKSAFFDGHFPGQPILPALAQLHLAQELAARSLGRAVQLSGIEHLRLRAPLGPGESFEALLGFSAQEDALDLTIQRGVERISAGKLELAPREAVPAPSAASSKGGIDRAPTSNAPATAQMHAALPHRGPALLLESVREAHEHSAVALARVPPDSPFVHAEAFPAYLALEMGAQASAAAEALARGGATEGPRVGFVVAVRGAHFPRPQLPADASYLVHSRLTRAAPPLRVWQVEVLLAGECVARCEVSTFRELGEATGA